MKTSELLFTHFGMNHLWKLFRNTWKKLFWDKKARSEKDGKNPKTYTSRYCRHLSRQWYWRILVFRQIPDGIYLSMSKPQVMIYLCARHLKNKVSKKKPSCLLKVVGRNNVYEILLPSLQRGIERTLQT